MYLKKIELENIKSFKSFKWALGEQEDPSGWHVLLGSNGSGKSTFIKAASIALIGPNEAVLTRKITPDWVKKGEEKGFIRLEIIQDKNIDIFFKKDLSKRTTKNIKPSVRIDNQGKLAVTSQKSISDNSFWNPKTQGWFSAAYGPFRRFSGGSNEFQKLFQSAPILARHLSVFGEDIALIESIEWLKDLRFKSLENPASIESDLLLSVMSFLNQDGFLPNNLKLHSVHSAGANFVDAFGVVVEVDSLSDGYRSILSMVLEIIRQLVVCYKNEKVFSSDMKAINKPGVVLIDEIDVHLHPSWQRTIGQWLTKLFPKIQFIVSTHSLLVCQSAINGSIWKLPSPEDDGGRVTGQPLQRLLYGNLLEAVSSGAFGDEINRSDVAKEKMQRLAELNNKQQFEQLSETEEIELNELASSLPLAN